MCSWRPRHRLSRRFDHAPLIFGSASALRHPQSMMCSESENHVPEVPCNQGIKSSLHALIAARFALIRHECKSALRDRTKAITSFVIATFLAFFAWALLLTGSIAAISIACNWPWHVVSLVFAALHLMAAIILVKAASSAAKTEPFPHTRSEFKKDCEWLESLQNDRKSKS